MLKVKRRSKGSCWLSYVLLFIGIMIMLRVSPTLAAHNGKDAAVNYKGMVSIEVEVMVKKGDTIWGLARQHGNPEQDVRITIAQIQEINSLAPSEPIYPGQKLIIPTR